MKFQKIGSPPPPKGDGGQSPASRPARRQAGKNQAARKRRLLFVTAKARPPSTGGRAPVLRLHNRGETHESANCSPCRQELQGVSVCRHIGNTGARGSCASGLVGGWGFGLTLSSVFFSIRSSTPNSSFVWDGFAAPQLGR